MARGRKLVDITGNTYNFLKVIGFSHIDENRRSYWVCECTRCGKVVILRKDAFAYHYIDTKSCGCWQPEAKAMYANERKNKLTGRFEKQPAHAV